jgi:hypothetical protein
MRKSFCRAVATTTPSIGLSVFAVALLGLTAMPALAQMPAGADPATGARPGHQIGVGESLPLSNRASNIDTADTRSNIAPTLPAPTIGNDGGSRDYLRAARASLIGGRTGQAQQSLEMAETRALDRGVQAGQTDVPSNSQVVSRIRDARHALGNHDRAHTIQLIDLALSS